jgi:predicted alpha/beta-hydrolase family hydrolase
MMRIAVDTAITVSAIACLPDDAVALYVMAHGAGAGMDHPFMRAVADGLATRHVATLRYQFPAMEQGLKRPDRPALAQATVRAAVAAAARLAEGLPLYAGGKSFGGRMTSQAQASSPLPGVDGLVFFGFPLHPSGKPSVDRAVHLGAVALPMLFMQGTRDALADRNLLAGTVAALGARATLVEAEGADHAFHVPARSSRTDAEVLAALLDAMSAWIAAR